MATREELEALGIEVIDSCTHPQTVAMSYEIAGKGLYVLGDKKDSRFPHVFPESVLIAPVGNLWDEGGWWHLQDMMLYSTQAGYPISLHEMRDTSPLPSQAIGLMRWQAAMFARDAGIEWVLMVDNDVMLEKDTLVRLLAHDRPVVFPLIHDLLQEYPPEVTPISFPRLEPGNGLIPVRWAVMSVMLFNTRVFNSLDSMAWWGNDHHFGQCLNYLGHKIYVDTDTVVPVTSGPTRGASLEYDAYWEARRTFDHRLKHEQRDRRPPPDFDPETDDGWLDEHGCYFAVKNEKK